MSGAARFVRATALALVALALVVPPAPRIPRHLVVISLDTLRADHLGAYGYGKPVSPTFDRLAGHGVLFERAIAQGPATLPSHGALMTGLYPSAYGDSPTPFAVPAWTETLAETLRRHGFATWGFTDGGYLRRAFGFDQGFEHYEDVHLGLERMIPRIDVWLARHPVERAFLFVHCYDIHTPYKAAPVDRAALGTQPWRGKYVVSVGELERLELERPQRSREDVAPVVDLYDAGIRGTDRALGRLLDALDRRGLLADALVVVLSDHGEEFLEHGRTQHKQLYFQPHLHVPLLVVAPGYAPAHVAEPVELIDVAPTALELLGLPPQLGGMGRSLVPLMTGASSDAPRAAYAEGTVWTASQRTLITDRHQLFFDTATGTARLYDHALDPRAEHDLAAAEPTLTTSLLAELQRRMHAAAAHRATAATTAAPARNPTPTVDADTQRDLRALGYLE